jgi:hypothetical protein
MEYLLRFMLDEEKVQSVFEDRRRMFNNYKEMNDLEGAVASCVWVIRAARQLFRDTQKILWLEEHAKYLHELGDLTEQGEKKVEYFSISSRLFRDAGEMYKQEGEFESAMVMFSSAAASAYAWSETCTLETKSSAYKLLSVSLKELHKLSLDPQDLRAATKYKELSEKITL